VGSLAEDYSARLLRDRLGLTDDASGVDIAYSWPHGGNKAWLRFNNALAAALPTNPTLSPIRAINYSPDGSAKYRIDRQSSPPFKRTATTDSVTIHTHVEFYRDTESRRAACLALLVKMAQEAINPTPPSPTTPHQEDFVFIGLDAAGVYYKCDGITAVPINPDNIKHMVTLAGEGAYVLKMNQPGWGDYGTYKGIIRTGFNSDAFGTPITVTFTDTQISLLADQISSQVEVGMSEDQVKTIINQTTLKVA
jgi:hypothetical protein